LKLPPLGFVSGHDFNAPVAQADDEHTTT